MESYNTGHLCLAASTLQSIVKVYPCCSVWQCFSSFIVGHFIGWKHHMLLIHWWTFQFSSFYLLCLTLLCIFMYYQHSLKKFFFLFRALSGSRQNWAESTEVFHVRPAPSATHNFLHDQHPGTFVTTDKQTLTHHHHPRSRVDLWAHSWHCAFYGFRQVWNDMWPRYSIIHNSFTALGIF